MPIRNFVILCSLILTAWLGLTFFLVPEASPDRDPAVAGKAAPPVEDLAVSVSP